MLTIALRSSILLFAFCVGACSVPNLESQSCNEARGVVKQLYSLHFAGDMRPSSENLKTRERFLTRQLYGELGSTGDGELDYFTKSVEPPQTFKIAKCLEGESDTRVELQVQIYWRDDNRTDQKELLVEVVKINGDWLVNKVSN